MAETTRFDTICDESGYLVFRTGMENAEKMAEMATDAAG